MVELKKMMGGKTHKKTHGGMNCKKKGKKGGMCGVCEKSHKKKSSKKKGGLNDVLLPALLVGANTYFKKSNKNKTKKNKSKRKGRK